MSTLESWGKVDTEWDVAVGQEHEIPDYPHPEQTQQSWLQYHRQKKKERIEAGGDGLIGVNADGSRGNFVSVHHSPALFNLRAVSRDSGGPVIKRRQELEAAAIEEAKKLEVENRLARARFLAKQKKLAATERLMGNSATRAERQKAMQEIDELVEKKRDGIWSRAKGGLADEKALKQKEDEDFKTAQQAYGYTDLNRGQRDTGKAQLGDERKMKNGQGVERYCALSLQYGPSKTWARITLSKNELEIRAYLAEQKKRTYNHSTEKERLIPPKERRPRTKRQIQEEFTALDFPESYRQQKRDQELTECLEMQYGAATVDESFRKYEQRNPRVDQETMDRAVEAFQEAVLEKKAAKKQQRTGLLGLLRSLRRKKSPTKRQTREAVLAINSRSREVRVVKPTLTAVDVELDDYEQNKKHTTMKRMADKGSRWKETLTYRPHPQPENDGFTVDMLLEACEVGETDTVLACKVAGVPTLCRNMDGRSPLHLAAINGHVDIIDLLLMHKLGSRHQLSINALDKVVNRRYTALHEGVHLRKMDVVRCLIKHGANLNAKEGILHRTPLMTALVHRHEEIACVLLGHGVNVFEKDINEDTALHLAVSSKCSKKMVKAILACGAEVHCKNKAGYEPGDLAVKAGRRVITDILKKFKRIVNVADIMQLEDDALESSVFTDLVLDSEEAPRAATKFEVQQTLERSKFPSLLEGAEQLTDASGGNRLRLAPIKAAPPSHDDI